MCACVSVSVQVHLCPSCSSWCLGPVQVTGRVCTLSAQSEAGSPGHLPGTQGGRHTGREARNGSSADPGSESESDSKSSSESGSGESSSASDNEDRDEDEEKGRSSER